MAADWLGQPDRDAFILHVLKLPLQRIELALEGLKWFDLTKPVPLEVAVKRGTEATMARMESAPAEVGPGQGKRTDLKPRDKITKLDRGTGATYLAARIKRDRPDIAAAVERGEFRSMRQAAIGAGIIKERSKVE